MVIGLQEGICGCCQLPSEAWAQNPQEVASPTFLLANTHLMFSSNSRFPRFIGEASKSQWAGAHKGMIPWGHFSYSATSPMNAPTEHPLLVPPQIDAGAQGALWTPWWKEGPLFESFPTPGPVLWEPDVHKQEINMGYVNPLILQDLLKQLILPKSRTWSSIHSLKFFRPYRL